MAFGFGRSTSTGSCSAPAPPFFNQANDLARASMEGLSALNANIVAPRTRFEVRGFTGRRSGRCPGRPRPVSRGAPWMEQRRRSKGPTPFSELVLRPLGALGRGFRELLSGALCTALACLLLAGVVWGWQDARAGTVALLVSASLPISAGALVLLHERRTGRPSRRPVWAGLAVASLLGFSLWASYVLSGCWVCSG